MKPSSKPLQRDGTEFAVYILIRKENCNVKTYENVVNRYLSNIPVFKWCFVVLGSSVRRQWSDALWWGITRDYAVYW
jgi:hypothetical protein